jgi:hypothetical protein
MCASARTIPDKDGIIARMFSYLLLATRLKSDPVTAIPFRVPVDIGGHVLSPDPDRSVARF